MKNIPKLQKPLAIQLPINDVCNSRCKMCRIWKQKRKYVISPSEIGRILNNSLFTDVKNIGINGGEPTLRDDLGEIVKTLSKTLPNLENIYLITNALKPNQVCKSISSMSEICHDNGLKLDVMVSLDGINEIHDEVRGCFGNFNSAVRVLDFLQASDNAVSYRVGCTVIKDNVFGVESLLDWCMRRDIHAYFRIGIPHRRLYNLATLQPFDLSFQEKFHLANFLDYLSINYEKNEAKRLFYKNLRNQIIYGKNRSVNCLWQSAGITINSSGEISYCAVQSETLGNAMVENPNKIYWRNQKHLAEIIQTKCSSCLHDYGPTPQMPGNFNRFKKKINELIPRKIHRIVSNLKQITKSKNTGVIVEENEIVSISKKNKLGENILICGWYGTETLGDKAILAGLIQAIRKCVDWKIDVVSLEPYVTLNTKDQMPDLKIDKILHMFEARSAILDGDYSAVIMGGGPLIGWIQECHDILDLFVRAQKVGATTIVGSCGVGPLGWPEIDSVIAEILKIADLVIFRDRHSRDIARKELGVNRNSYVTLDPAFVWAYSESNRNRQKRDPKQILLALRDWSIKDYGSHIDHKSAEQVKKDFENELRKMIKQLLSKDPDLKIIPFCMHKYARGGDDRFFYRRVFADYPKILENLDDFHREPIKDLRMFTKSHSVLAMRFHSLVFAIATGTPVLAIDYTFGGKIAGLLADIKAQHLMIKLDEFSGEAAVNTLLAAPHSSAEIKEQIENLKSTLCRILSRAFNKTSNNERC